jgi:hypothetical protein
LIERHYLDDCLVQLRKLKTQADRAIAQIGDQQFFAELDPEANSIALLMKHISGNIRSRSTDFLTTDGEKPDRNRDGEFEIGRDDSRAAIESRWEESWRLLFGTIGSLQPGDLEKTVTIRGEVPHGRAGAEPPGVALLGACGSDRAAREALRRPALADVEYPEEKSARTNLAGGFRFLFRFQFAVGGGFSTPSSSKRTRRYRDLGTEPEREPEREREPELERAVSLRHRACG